MRSVVGVTAVGLGLGFALYATAPDSIDREAQVAAVTRIIAQSATPEGPAVVAAEQPGLRQPVTIATPEPLMPTALSRAAAAVDPARVTPVPHPLSSEMSQAGSADTDKTMAAAPWQVVITTGTATAGAADPKIASAAAGAKRPAPKDKIKLARLIQSELKRVGCYDGKIDGAWGPGSQYAMTSFVHSVNASLPTTEPDVILLHLVQGHSGTLCAQTCENGSGGTACPRSTVVADVSPAQSTILRSPAPAQVAAVGPIPAPKPATRPEPLPGRMAVGALTSPAEFVPAGVARPEDREVLPWQGERVGADLNRARSLSEDAIASPHLAALEQANSDISGSNQPPHRTKPLSSVPHDADEPPPKAKRNGQNAGANRTVSSAASDKRPQKQVERQKKRNRYATRSVQSLFLHPLGRM